MNNMKIISANVWGGRLESQILSFVREQQPDILCLQELIDIKGGKSAMFASLEEIQEAAQAEYTFMSPVFSMNYMTRKADFGNCIISKYPIVNKKTIFTGKEYAEDFDFLHRNADMRNLQLADIQTPDGEIVHVLNHHGHHINQHKNGDAETMRQCGIIASEITKLNGKVVVCGDFNLAPHSESLEQINALLTNLPVKNKLVTTRNQLTHKSEVCDYIFVSEDVSVDSFEASEEIISDHKALIAKLAN